MRAATRWLRRNGVGPGDVVSLLAPNCTATNVAYWAAMSSAAVQPLNLLFTREAIAAQVNAVKAKILFTPPPGAPGGLYEKVEGLQALAPSLERIVVLPLDGRVAFDGEMLTPSRRFDNADVSDPDRIVALLPTGGTTGAPKVVPLSNRNVVSSAIGSMLAVDLRPEDRHHGRAADVSCRRRLRRQPGRPGRGCDDRPSDRGRLPQSGGRRELLAHR